jgi:hypothetical protein
MPEPVWIKSADSTAFPQLALRARPFRSLLCNTSVITVPTTEVIQRHADIAQQQLLRVSWSPK